jgi:tRNA G10  N-methylase Trm11
MEQIEVFGTDIREERVLGTRQNLDYTSQLMDMTFPKKYLEDHILQLNITDLPDHFKLESFDGIVSEPVLLPFYRTMPRFNEAQKEVETNVLPVYKQLLQIAHDLLKMNHRLAVISPIINTSEKKTIKLPLKRLAQQVGFQQIDLIQSNRISEKSSHNLGLKAQLERTLFDKGTEVISREFYILEKIS